MEYYAGGCENTAVRNGLLIVAGNDAALDTSTSQNVGLYEVQQPEPWQVLPDRFNAAPPLAAVRIDRAEPVKARALREGRRILSPRPASPRP
jgi:hypothetical protein